MVSPDYKSKLSIKNPNDIIRYFTVYYTQRSSVSFPQKYLENNSFWEKILNTTMIGVRIVSHCSYMYEQWSVWKLPRGKDD